MKREETIQPCVKTLEEDDDDDDNGKEIKKKIENSDSVSRSKGVAQNTQNKCYIHCNIQSIFRSLSPGTIPFRGYFPNFSSYNRCSYS